MKKSFATNKPCGDVHVIPVALALSDYMMTSEGRSSLACYPMVLLLLLLRVPADCAAGLIRLDIVSLCFRPAPD